jgi:hypothetical protein
MSLSFWITLWKIVLIGGIALFGALAIVVTIGGFRDVVRLIEHLRSSHVE